MPRMVLPGLIAVLTIAITATAQDGGAAGRADAALGQGNAPAPPSASGPPPERETSASAQPAVGRNLPDDPWASPEIAAPRMDARPLPRKRESTTHSAGDATQAPSSSSWGRTTLSLLGVVALIVLLAWGYRLIASHGGSLRSVLRARHPGLIEVVSRAALSPRQAVCLVRVGPRLVLLGCTHESVRALDVIDDADLVARLLGQAAQQRPGSHTAEFARCLEHEAGAYTGEAQAAEVAAAPNDTQLAATKEQLAATIQRLRGTWASET